MPAVSPDAGVAAHLDDSWLTGGSAVDIKRRRDGEPPPDAADQIPPHISHVAKGSPWIAAHRFMEMIHSTVMKSGLMERPRPIA